MKDNTKIYYLHNGDNVPFYVGKTVNINTNQRLNSHKKEYGKEIYLETLDIIPTLEWQFWERFYIALLKSWEFKLNNKNFGGGGCITHEVSKEARQIIGDTHRGKSKSFSESHIKNLKNALQNKKVTWGNKISKGLKGRKVTWNINFYTKSINQYDLEGNFIKKWSSIVEPTRIYKGNISACCRGKQKTSSNYIWKYA